MEKDISISLGNELEFNGVKRNPNKVTVKEVYLFALDIEKKSELLYIMISNIVKKQDMISLFLFFAEEEKKHFLTFQRMLGDIGHLVEKESVSENTGTMLLYMKSKVFSKEELAEKLKNMKDIDSIYEFAISMELEQILFYNEIRESVHFKQQGFIDDIIDEERRHFLRILQMRQARGE